MNSEQIRVKDLKEQGLLAILKQFCPSEVIGDDGAVLDVPQGQQLVVTTDVLVQDVHFSDQTTEAEDVGWRSVTANLSDLAAMGAFPLGITVGLGLTGDTSVAWLKRLYQGMTDCLQTYQTVILGGDICRASQVTVSITALGRVFPERVIRRSTARVGDGIIMTGKHGLSRAGLELLLYPEKKKDLTESCQNKLIQAHQRPRPRLDIIKRLYGIENLPSVAGMDSSDGLADAIVQICNFSGVGAQIDLESLVISPELIEWVGFEQALNWTLYGGEDFELVLCLPWLVAQNVVSCLGKEAKIIGKIIKDKQIALINPNEPDFCHYLSLDKGFQHFTN